jgi:hypothetical protein
MRLKLGVKIQTRMTAKPRVTIPYIDLRGAFTPLDLVFLRRKQARAMLDTIKSTFGVASRLPSGMLLRAADRTSRRWLTRTDNPYLWEISEIAKEVGEAGVFALNICLEWGCTGGIWQGAEGPLLRRTLDWPFPRLGENLVVLHLSGPGGAYFNITWPGLAGVFHGLAPKRFAAAINQAPMRKSGGGLVVDWAMGRVAVGRNFGLPPSHLLRQVFETAPDYASAKRLLCTTQLAVPAIFLLAGIEDGEGCVIERTEEAFSVREMASLEKTAGRVCAANQFEAPPEGKKIDWRTRPIDSAGRYTQACMLDSEGHNFSWFEPPIANENTRVALVARARPGRLSLVGTEGPAPVTEILRIPPEE